MDHIYINCSNSRRRHRYHQQQHQQHQQQQQQYQQHQLQQQQSQQRKIEMRWGNTALLLLTMIVFTAIGMTNGKIINTDFALHEKDSKFPPISCVYKHRISEDKTGFNFVEMLLDSKEYQYYFIVDREHKIAVKALHKRYPLCDAGVDLLSRHSDNEEKRNINSDGTNDNGNTTMSTSLILLQSDDVNNKYHRFPPNNAVIVFDDLQTIANTAKYLGYYTTYLLFSAVKMLECNPPSKDDPSDSVATFICGMGKTLSPHVNSARNYIYGLNSNNDNRQHQQQNDEPSPQERIAKSKFAKWVVKARNIREKRRKKNEKRQKEYEEKHGPPKPVFQRLFPSTHAKIGNPLSWQQQKSYASRFYDMYKEEIGLVPTFMKHFVQNLAANIDTHELRATWQIPQVTQAKWGKLLQRGAPLHQATINFFKNIKRDITHLQRVTSAGAIHYGTVLQHYKTNPSHSYVQQVQHFMNYIHTNNFYMSKRYRHAIMQRYEENNHEEEEEENNKSSSVNRISTMNYHRSNTWPSSATSIGRSAHHHSSSSSSSSIASTTTSSSSSSSSSGKERKKWSGFTDENNEIQLNAVGFADMIAYFLEWLLHINSSNGAPFDEPPCNPGFPWLPEAGKECFYPVLNASSYSFWPIGFNPFYPNCGPYQSLQGYFYALVYTITTPILGPYLSTRPQLNATIGFLVNNATGYVCNVTTTSEIFSLTMVNNYLCGLNALPPNTIPCMSFSVFWGFLAFFVGGMILTALIDVYMVIVRMQEIETGKDLGFSSTLGGQGFKLLPETSKALGSANEILGLGQTRKRKNNKTKTS